MIAPRAVAAASVALALALAGSIAHAEPPGEIATAQAAAAAGDWPRVDAVLAPLRTNATLAPGDRAEIDRLSGLAAYFEGRRPAAADAFLAYLLARSDGALDPSLYPPDAIAFFEGVRVRHRAEIEARRPRARGSIWLSLIPVEAQRQNGEPVKGIVLGGALGVALAGNVTTYLVLRHWCDAAQGGSSTCDAHGDHESAAKDLRIANYALGIGAAAIYVYGVYDGISHYRARAHRSPLQPYATSEVVGLAGSF